MFELVGEQLDIILREDERDIRTQGARIVPRDDRDGAVVPRGLGRDSQVDAEDTYRGDPQALPPERFGPRENGQNLTPEHPGLDVRRQCGGADLLGRARRRRREQQ
jgi:hypothetical protein